MQSIAILILLSSCSLFLPSSKTKDAKEFYQITVPSDWREHKTDLADYQLLGPQGSSLVLQSFCNEFQNAELSQLATTTFRSLDRATIKEQKKFMLQNREALRSQGEAYVDGVKVNLTLINTKRNNCYFDFFEIIPSKSTSVIDDFMQRVKFK